MQRGPNTSHSSPARRRHGKALAFLIVGLSAILGVVGLVFDTGLIMADKENLQHATDAAATAGAVDLLENKPSATATATATNYLMTLNDFADAQITTNIPPTSGVYAGRTGFVEVIATRQHKTELMHTVGAAPQSTITARAVAGYEPSTAGAAIVVLDPNPPGLQVNANLPTLPVYPTLVGGLEILGIGSVRVDGAVIVNTTWGGVDQNGNPAGTSSGLPWAVSCTPLLPLTRLQARDIRVVGGVDNQKNYGNYVGGQASPLVANALPVADPFMQTPVPTTGADSANVKTTYFGGKQVLQLPLIVLPTVLNPGVYDWIEILSGSVVFNPGVYIIRGVSPTTGIALNIAAGTVTANGVLFYITNSTSYDATSGSPDGGDAETRPDSTSLSTGTPSVVIGAVLPGSSFRPLSSASSPFNNLLIYQRRQDYRPIVIAYQSLLGGVVFQGTVYAKWGHVLFAGDGTLDLRIVSGSARLVPVLGLTLQPSQLLPPASDVFLVE